MVTKIRKGIRPHLYIKEWMDDRDLSDEKVAARLEVARETVWRWRTEQHRLNPTKLSALATAIGIQPQDFWRPPSRPSVDELLRDEPIETIQRAADVVRIMVRKGKAA